jgi:drug/metabolite transporter (DMT)-like permease
VSEAARAVGTRAVAKPSTLAVVSAFAAVYVLWGSTYLGIRFSIETLPPFFTQGVRFLLAGVVLYAWGRLRGEAAPTRREWGGATITGALLFVGGSGGLVWAEHYVPSGVAALVVATEPLSFVLLDAMRRRRRPHGVVLAGLALGSAGLLVLVGPGTFFGGERFHLAACLVLVAGTFAWAWGSLFSRGSRLPSSPMMATAATLVSGGALLALVGLSAGELAVFDPAAVSVRSVVATAYLFVFGSIVGFSAYLWLLRVSTPSRVSTYAYVNPIVAVFLGWALAGETLSPRVLLAAVIIVGAVALIIRHGGADGEDEGVDEPGAEDFGCAKAPETLHA